MDIGLIGLGRMGLNMLRRLVNDGHRVIGYSRSGSQYKEVEAAGGEHVGSIETLVSSLKGRRVIWLMIPSGDPVDDAIKTLLPLLNAKDIVVDGGNSNWRDSKRRHTWVKEHGVDYIDAGTSGGVWGLTVGYCLMVGGEAEPVAYLGPAMKSLAPENGFLHVGPPGAGHFVKMVHNGIEYGMLQAYGEGFEILNASEFNLDLRAISSLWNQGSVIRSWLLELAEAAFGANPGLDGIAGYVEDSGEGRWTVAEAIELNIPAPVITLSLLTRLRSRQDESYSAKVIAALRNQFGGHSMKPTKKD